VMQSIKLITREASRNVAEYAFKYAISHGKKKITAAHKASVMYASLLRLIFNPLLISITKTTKKKPKRRLSDGLFLKSCKEVSCSYPHIQYEDMSIDKVCMQVSQPYLLAYIPYS